jgi:hypothetical protein
LAKSNTVLLLIAILILLFKRISISLELSTEGCCTKGAEPQNKKLFSAMAKT